MPQKQLNSGVILRDGARSFKRERRFPGPAFSPPPLPATVVAKKRRIVKGPAVWIAGGPGAVKRRAARQNFRTTETSPSRSERQNHDRDAQSRWNQSG